MAGEMGKSVINKEFLAKLYKKCKKTPSICTKFPFFFEGFSPTVWPLKKPQKKQTHETRKIQGTKSLRTNQRKLTWAIFLVLSQVFNKNIVYISLHAHPIYLASKGH